MKCNSPSVFQISPLPEVFNRPNFSSAQWDFVKQFLFEYLLIRAVETLGEGEFWEKSSLLFFDRAPVHLSVHTLAAQGCQYHTDWTLIDILVHPIYEHSDEESKIFALRYIMVISHTKVNRQLNIGMIVGFDICPSCLLMKNQYKYIFER